MVIYDRTTKNLVIPKGLGAFSTNGGGTGGVTPEEAAEIASAVTEAAIDAYDADLQDDLNGIRTAVSGNTDDIVALSAATEAISGSLGNYATTATTDALSAVTSALTQTVENLSGSIKEDVILDVAEIDNMSYADRKVLWDEVYAKILAGHKVYAKGGVINEPNCVALLPLEKYIPETNPEQHTGGFMFFAAKDYNENIYLSFGFSSAGNLSGLDSDSKFRRNNIYNMPTAATNTLGGVKVGSGLTIDGNGVLSVSGGTGGGAKVYYLDEMTQAELIALYNEIFTYTEFNFPSGNYRFFVMNDSNDEYQGRFEVFVARLYEGEPVCFSGVMQSRYNNTLLQRGYELDSAGNFSETFRVNTAIPTAPAETVIGITSGGTLDGDFEGFYGELLNNTNNGAAVMAPFPILFREEIPDSGETYFAGTVEAFTMGHSTQDGNDNWAIFTARLEWNGRTRVGKWKIWYNDGWYQQTLYWGWLLDGLVCVYDDEYADWTQTEKEDWYDRIIEEVWNYDNTSFGIVKVSNKTASADTGYNHISVVYDIYKLDSVEAGYNSLHFSGSEKSGDSPSERIYNARIQRGGNIEYWEKNADFGWLYNMQPQSSGGRTFDFTTGGTPYGYFDTYLFPRCFGDTHNNWEYYGAASYGAIRIVDGNGDVTAVANVITARPLTASDYADMNFGVKVVFDFLNGSDIKRVIGDAVWGGSSEGWNLISITTV